MATPDDTPFTSVKRDQRLALGIIAGVIGMAIFATLFVSLAPPPRASRLAPPPQPAAALKVNLANDVAAAVASAQTSVQQATTMAEQARALVERARARVAGGDGIVKLTLAGGLVYRGEGEGAAAEGLGLVSGGRVAFGGGYFVGGVRNGVGADCARADCTGPSYFGDFRGDRATGSARIVFEDGAVYLGDVVDGAPHGFGELKRADGSRYVGAFSAGRRDGYGVDFSAAGAQQRGFWVNDQLSESAPS